MSRIIATAFLAVFLSAPASAADVNTEFLQGLGNSQYHAVNSDIVGRPYHIYVMLPDGYDAAADSAYPVIYLLDGGALFPMLVAYYRYLNFGEEVPNAIIVGVSYGSNTFEGGNLRSTDYTAPSEERDYWGGADTFQKFLAGELLPFIEERYKANAQRRIIFGQSIGGQFVLYTALTRPQLFWGHIASNPALHRNLPFFLEYHGKPPTSASSSKLFVSSGSQDDPRFREPALQWIQHWQSIRDKPWLLKSTDLEGHSHMSAPPAAFRAGLRWLFSD